MNREELTELVEEALNIDEVLDVLWPAVEERLAQLWWEAFHTGKSYGVRDALGENPMKPPNPYTQHSALDTDSDRGHTQT